MKKFYKTVDVEQANNHDGFVILLDGKPIKTPSKQSDMLVPTKKLADQVALEWEKVDGDINFDHLPFTKLINTASEYVEPKQKDIEKEILNYLETDLLLYHTSEPEELAIRQKKDWGEPLTWFVNKASIDLKVRTDLGVTTLSDQDKFKARDIMRDMSLYQFTAFQSAVALTGSFILGYGLILKKYTSEHIFSLCRLEEIFFKELYKLDNHGPDPIQEKTEQDLISDLQVLESFLKFV